ncbi:head-tail adaptor protein [Selenomonas sp.]|uniref:head-tail adaptor protein n=1 Tax=Selenomonas sp. TaxID=2053611 RepID=UPI003FA319AA
MNVDKMNRRVMLLRPESPLDEINGCDTTYTPTREVWAEFLKPGFVSRALFGDAAAVEVTQRMRLRPVEVAKGWRIKHGEHVFHVEHIDDTTPGELILTTSEVQL